MALMPTNYPRQNRLISFWQRHPRHHCIPNIARAQLHTETTPIPKAPRESDALRLGDVERIKCAKSAQKERSGESTPDQTEAGFNILCLARAEREKLESAKPAMLSEIEVLTQTIMSQFKSKPSVKIRTETCAPAVTPSARHTL